MKYISGKYLTILFIGIASFLCANAASACDIDFKVVENQKAVYKPGDIVVIKVVVTITHRRCRESLKSTKFHPSGLEIVSSSSWETGARNKHYKTITVKVKKTKKGKSTLSAERTCHKEGGFGKIVLTTK
jgi:hypothetical protein